MGRRGKLNHIGCPELLDTVTKVKPQVHMFGHIHEAYGTDKKEDTFFINAASIDKVTKKLTNAPVVLGMTQELGVQLISGGSSAPRDGCEIV